LAPQRLSGAQDVLLADVIFQALRAHTFRQRPVLVRRARGVAGLGRSGIEQAHGRIALCRRASYNRIPAAMAAFRDSTPTVGMKTSSAAERSASLTPRASLPTIKPQRAVKSTSATERIAAPARAGTPAYSSTLFCCSAARASVASTPCRYGTRNREPAEARRVLGFHGLTDPLRKRMPVAPKASAARAIAPALPGSCNPSRTTTNGRPRNNCSSFQTGGLTSAITPWLVLVPESRWRRASGRTTTLMPANRRTCASAADRTDSAASTVFTSQSLRRASSSRGDRKSVAERRRGD